VRNMYRWFAWNVLFRAHELAKGHSTFAILRDMEAADRLPPLELETLRARKLHELIEYSYAYVPFVRAQMEACGVQPSQMRQPSDLRRLPLMRKADVRKHRADLRSTIARDLSSFSTGGSTGEPLLFDLGKRRIAARVACRQRVSRWWGVSVGDPEFAIWGSPVELSHQDRIRDMRDWLLNTRLLPAFEMNEATITRYLDTIELHGCRQLFGYPSAIDLLCRHARNEKRDLHRVGIRAAFVTGEVLLPHQREMISATLGCPVADGYGGRDSGFIAHECPSGGMHVLDDAVIVEILDTHGNPVEPGEPGEIVVTDLYSHEFPFIRYATGDMAVMAARRCACGRSSTLLERIEGRCNDSVITPDGRVINSLALIYAIREIEGVGQFRIIQKALDDFHVQLVPTGSYRLDAEGRIREAWGKLLRVPVGVSFEYLQALPVERSGKFRHVVSELPADWNARLRQTAHSAGGGGN
jgi:phenylacetate-CoA ligase